MDARGPHHPRHIAYLGDWQVRSTGTLCMMNERAHRHWVPSHTGAEELNPLHSITTSENYIALEMSQLCYIRGMEISIAMIGLFYARNPSRSNRSDLRSRM